MLCPGTFCGSATIDFIFVYMWFGLCLCVRVCACTRVHVRVCCESGVCKGQNCLKNCKIVQLKVSSLSCQNRDKARKAIILLCNLPDSKHFPQPRPWQPTCFKCHWPLGAGCTHTTIAQTTRCQIHANAHTHTHANQVSSPQSQTNCVFGHMGAPT